MEILYLLIPVSLVIIALAVGVFFWAVKSGQYEDLEGPAWRILYDDEPELPKPPADPSKPSAGTTESSNAHPAGQDPDSRHRP